MAWNTGLNEVPTPTVSGAFGWGAGKVYLPYEGLDTDTGYIREGFQVSGSWTIPWTGAINIPPLYAIWHMIVGEVWGCSVDVPVSTVSGRIPSWGWASDIVIPVPSIISYMDVGGVFSGNISIPTDIIVRGSFYAIPDVHGGIINVPVPFILGYLKSSIVSPFRKAMVMNVAHGGVSEYTNFSFNSFGYFNGIYFGANETGIYRLDAEKHGGDIINSEIRLPMQDLGIPVSARMREAWITMRSSGNMVLFVQMEEHGEWTQDIEFLKNQIHESRVKIARGLKGRFASVGMRSVDGHDFDINGIRVIVEFVKRKIR